MGRCAIGRMAYNEYECLRCGVGATSAGERPAYPIRAHPNICYRE